MEAIYKNAKGKVLSFYKNEGYEDYTLNLKTEDGSESFTMLSEEEIKEIEFSEEKSVVQRVFDFLRG